MGKISLQIAFLHFELFLHVNDENRNNTVIVVVNPFG